MMRCDVNISLRPSEQNLWNKTELKNMNSFGNIEKAVRAEIARQQEILESGGKIIQETRGWDADKEISVSQRTKEEAADYRYFPEPDIPPITFSEEEISVIRKSLPELPAAKTERFATEHHVAWEAAEIIAGDAELSAYFETALATSGDAIKPPTGSREIFWQH